jgi:hypothetical protein
MFASKSASSSSREQRREQQCVEAEERHRCDQIAAPLGLIVGLLFHPAPGVRSF